MHCFRIIILVGYYYYFYYRMCTICSALVRRFICLITSKLGQYLLMFILVKDNFTGRNILLIIAMKYNK